jgi:hypothetical protein
MVKRALWRFALGIGLLLPCLAWPSTAIVYQPQLRDRELAPARWPPLFTQLREQGFDTLVVQWTQYGDAFDDPAAHAWLLARVREAHAAGLRVVLGLSSDPAFFQRQQAAATALDGYLHGLARRNGATARRWADELGVAAIDGWYLPMEVDDKRWREPGARQSLQAYLQWEYRQLQQVAPRPVYVSSFFAGNMTPARYAQLLAQMQSTGVRVWVQDGAGTARLAQGERKLYLDAASQCGSAHAQGVVFEIFHQLGSDQAFSASSLGAAAATAALAQRAPCHGDSVFFELRYLPDVARVVRR